MAPIRLCHFTFVFVGSGQYRVTYTSPNTGKSLAATITDMTLIDKTKNSECPKRTDLERLKKAIKKKTQ
jgi:hypothetical protein